MPADCWKDWKVIVIVRLLATDGRSWDLDVPDLEMINVRVIQFQGMIFFGPVGEDFRDKKWLSLFRQTRVKFLRAYNEKSLEEKRQEYLDRAAKQLDDAFERGRDDAKRLDEKYVETVQKAAAESRKLLQEVWRGYDGLGCPGCEAVWNDRAKTSDEDDGFDHEAKCPILALRSES